MTTRNRPIPLFWWSEIKFIFKEKENYGDLLSKYIVEKVTRKPVKWIHPKKQAWYKWNKINYLAVGSILHHANQESIVWGSGIIDRKHKIAKADFRAVRGPQTRKFLIEKGYLCPKVYGDPALLLPEYFNPVVKKEFKLGIVPHYHDFQEVWERYKDEEEILVIDVMTMDVEAVTRQFLHCEKIISSSLHGIIVSHAYEIPSIWVEFSKKLFGDGIKFQDYLESVEIKGYKPEILSEKIPPYELEKLFLKFPSLPSKGIVDNLKRNLLENSPF